MYVLSRERMKYQTKDGRRDGDSGVLILLEKISHLGYKGSEN